MKPSAATAEFLDQLQLRGVKLWVEGDRLRYSAPAGIMNEDVLGELRRRKPEIISSLHPRQQSAGAAIEALPRDGLLPLSFAQQRIWFLDQLEPENPFYNVTLAKHIHGPLDIDCLRNSLLELIKRHEVLHSICINTDEGPQISVVPPEEFGDSDHWFAVEHLPETTSDSELQQRVNAEVRCAVRLNQAPLLRVRLFCRGSLEAVLAFATHHFVVDGWSCGIMMRELSEIYAALTEGRAAQLQQLTRHYADFAAWQARWLEGSEPKRQLAFWDQQLQNLATLDLPVDKPRPPVLSYKGSIYHFELPTALTRQLKEFARSEGLTLYMCLLAGFQILLHRYSQQDEVVVGTAVSNRHTTELEGLLGPFVNTLVLRGDLAGNPGFRQLVHKARDIAAAAFAHQDLPFEVLVEHLKPERDRSRSPLFQILFVVHQYSSAEELRLAGSRCTDFPVSPGTTMYDLFLQLVELNGTLSGSVEYSTDLFESSTIKRMVSHLATLLVAAADAPDTPILDLPLMDPDELRQLSSARNAAAMDFPRTLRIEQLFAQQALRTPDSIAIGCGDTNLNYAELELRANQLAGYLRASGLNAGDLAGIYLERSPDMLIALLAVMQAGATYVPLDPIFPAERIRFMMADAGLACLITHSMLRSQLTDCPDLVVELDTSPVAAAPPLGQTPDAHATADSLAYVIYTSGSTGQPKGVQLSHRNVVNFLTSMALEPGMTAADRLVAVTTLSFDIAVLELFLPLCTGGCVVIAEREVAADGARLARLIASSNATVMQATPATWQLLLNAGWRGHPGLKALCGGEALPRELADRLIALGLDLWNMYGPTETTIWSSISHVPAEGPITIGKPIGNTRMYILDSQLRALPVGVPGELCIAGEGVSCGYRGRPELTADRFVQDPFGEPGQLLYRTGDLARYRDNGDIECLGRNDNQVKIRGYRMELGEIEAALVRHPMVNQAIVVAREDRTGEKRLAGYLIASPSLLEGDDATRSRDEQLSQWRDLWQNAYAGSEMPDPAFDISGWKSSYTGQPIPAPQMREWVESTAARISSLGAKRILEIGAGTGLLVARVAPHCQRYLAVDFSPASVRAVNRLCSGQPDLAHVEARQLAADALAELQGEQFDLIILNSVAQYFPDQRYLLGVLQAMAALLSANGRMFLGDLRCLALLDAYHASVQLSQADDELPLNRLADRVRMRREGEEELLLDPAFFSRLDSELPGLKRVEFQLKDSTVRNEMTCFRYDVVLYQGGAGVTSQAPASLEWQADSDMDWLNRQLQKIPVGGLLVTAIADARLQPEILTLRALQQAATDDNPDTTAGHLRQSVLQTQAQGLQPCDIYRLAEANQLSVQLIFTAPGLFNALFSQPGEVHDGRLMLPARNLALAECSNNPLQSRIERNLAPALREHLQKSLPDYMVPSSYAMLTQFPLTPNGKIDRKALPAPDQPTGPAYTPPRNATEVKLAGIWEELLAIDQVGVLDDFFGLGGHSLLATQLVSRIRNGFQLNIPLNTLFDHPTVAKLAVVLDTLNWARDGVQAAPESGADIVELEI